MISIKLNKIVKCLLIIVVGTLILLVLNRKESITVNEVSISELHMHSIGVFNHSSINVSRWVSIGHNILLWNTAHHEMRKEIYGSQALIVIGFHPKNITIKPSLYCQLIYSDGTKTCLPDRADWFEFLRSSPKPNEIFVAYNLMWKLPMAPTQANFNLKTIRVSTNALCTPSSADILLFKDKLNKTGTIGLCMHKALFNVNDPQRIVSWIELNLAMGVELITLYYQSVSIEVEKAVQFYVDTGKVEVIHWKINISNSLIYNVGQLGSIQDCFYRNFHRFKYILFHDIDEVIVPHSHNSLQAMMKEIDSKGNHISYFRFYNSFWHDVGKIMEGANTTRLGCPQINVPIFFRSTHRTIDANIPQTIRHKIIVKPEGCYRINIHNVKSEVKTYQRMTVDISLGLMHHYRLFDDYKKEEQVPDYSVGRYTVPVMDGLMKQFCNNAHHSNIKF